MAYFTTTIELTEANENDYQVLHAELAKESFREVPTKVVQGARKKYDRDGRSLPEVTKALLNALVKTGKKFSFTIVRGKAERASSLLRKNGS